MRMLIGAFGTRGDVQPMIELAQVMRERGHEVSVAVPPSSLEYARSRIPEAFTVGLDYRALAKQTPRGSLGEMIAVLPLIRQEVEAQLSALEERSAAADVIVGCSVFTVGTLFAERHRRPFALFCFCPQMVPSSGYPSPAFASFGLPRWVNRLTWWINERMWRFVLKPTLNRARAARSLPAISHVWSSILGPHPIVACDPALALAPVDYEHPVAQTGAIFARELEELSPATSAFLDAGPPPVYLGFGSMADPDPRATTERLVAAVRLAKVRALISKGWADLAADALPPEVLLIGPEPHGKLFARCAATVHHGGAGTTHASLRAGVPQVLMPQLLDQHYWANRVQRLGLGPAQVSRHARDPALLAKAIRACVEDAAMKERVRKAAASLQLDGAVRAAVRLEELARAR